MLGDSPLVFSGIGTQLHYICEALIATGRYQILSLAGAHDHADWRPHKTNKFGDDLIIVPVKHYGDEATVRGHLRSFKPDIVLFMTDPRYWEWLWSIENEIRPLAPMVYYHVWDNYPIPWYNKKFYESTDVIVTISKLTDDIVSKVAPGAKRHYLPHAVNTDIFARAPEEKIKQFRKNLLSSMGIKGDRFIFLFNSRNAKRKQTGSMLFWFREFLDQVGENKAVFVMHTQPFDPHGPNLVSIVEDLNLAKNVMFSTEKCSPEDLSIAYSAADCTLQLSDSEGFGLSVTESLACGTPVIGTKTGGIQDQIIDGDMEYGVCLPPVARPIVGTQETPYIHEDYHDSSTVVPAMRKIFEMDKGEREELGRLAAESVRLRFGFENYKARWVEIMDETHREFGSWPVRGYKSWTAKKIG